MNLPSNLFARLLLALGFALVAIVVLAFVVEAFDDGPKRTLRAQPVEPDAAAEAAQRAPSYEYELLEPRHQDALGFELGPLAGTLAVAARASALPPDIAPVVEVLGDGTLALRRPRPLAEGPAAAAPRSRDGHGAGLVLPAERLDALTPQARGALGGLLLRWFPQRPFPRARLRPVGFELSTAELERLVRWLP
ncbi:MAG: hypothetical protein ACE37K_05350 [Planctomycetota bacterium]